MRFHKDRENRLRQMPLSPINVQPPRNATFVMRSPEILSQHPVKQPSPRSESLSLGDEISEESPVIVACYEAYLSMEKMLSAFAELRGDDTEGGTDAAHASYHN